MRSRRRRLRTLQGADQSEDHSCLGEKTISRLVGRWSLNWYRYIYIYLCIDIHAAMIPLIYPLTYPLIHTQYQVIYPLWQWIFATRTSPLRRTRRLLDIFDHVHFTFGWWFGTWLLFFHSVGNVIIPIDFHILRGVETTNQICLVWGFSQWLSYRIYIYIHIWLKNFVVKRYHFITSWFKEILMWHNLGPKKYVDICRSIKCFDACLSDFLKLSVSVCLSI